MSEKTTIEPKIDESWKKLLYQEFQKDYFHHLKTFLQEEKKQHAVYPPSQDIFNAFNLTPADQVRVVIIGQDPYHGVGQAHGLCFSVKDGVKHPPSLKNIFKEIESDLHIPIPTTGNLTPWAKQGILLLNATLTVRASQAGSHQNKGWEEFTDAVIRELTKENEHLIFLLWGRYAQDKAALIDNTKHHLLKAAHPSPFSAYNGFLGCRHFSRTNELLLQIGKTEIDWRLE